MFNIFLYLNLCGKNCFLKKLVGQNVRHIRFRRTIFTLGRTMSDV